jgi:hypothetical protein
MSAPKVRRGETVEVVGCSFKYPMANEGFNNISTIASG